MKFGQFGQLIISDEGDIFNKISNKNISIFYDAKGNPLFRSPDTLTNFRVDYVVAMLFLNNGEFIENIKDYYIRHLDNDPKNCKLSNLELITDPEEVKEIRFGFLLTADRSKKRTSSLNRMFYPLYVANKETLSVEVYSMSEFCKKFGMSATCANRKAKACERVYKDNFNLYVCETMLEAWECL